MKLNEFLKNIGKDHGVLDLRSPCCNVPFLRILETRICICLMIVLPDMVRRNEVILASCDLPC